jgi:hypothetical protein
MNWILETIQSLPSGCGHLFYALPCHRRRSIVVELQASCLVAATSWIPQDRELFFK